MNAGELGRAALHDDPVTVAAVLALWANPLDLVAVARWFRAVAGELEGIADRDAASAIRSRQLPQVP